MSRPFGRNGTRDRIRALFSTVKIVSSNSVAFALQIPVANAGVHLSKMTQNGELQRLGGRYPAAYRRVG